MTTSVDTAQHGLTEHSHGGWATVPVQTRSERFASPVHSEHPEVTGREAVWKFTPVDKLRELIDGALDGAPYPVEWNETAGATLEWIPRDHALIGTAGNPEERASANAWTNMEQALHIRVEGEFTPLTVRRDGLGSTPRAGHILVTAERGARGLIVLDSRGDAKLSENIEIVLGPDADVKLVTVHEWDDTALHLASLFARVGHGANLTHVLVSLGGGVVRVNPSVHLAEEGAGTELYGVYFADAGQHLEQQVYVNHDAPHSRSRVTYKGALNGDGARTVWIGDVLISRSATAADTYEENRNLVLSDGTRADSIPNLEIETGEIAGAGHASATGRFDDEQLFYLQARGIPEDEARRLVVLGFLGEVVQKIGEPTLEAHLMEALEAELEKAR